MSQKEIAVAVKDIHKEFILPQNKNSTFKQTVVNIVKKGGKVTQKTLDGVSFDVYKGDFFGIVGRNGSGKSTLLKLIAGVYSPTAGNVAVHGGLTPFIELGVGFNPELSGRDNVYLNGALLGFTHKQVAKMYDAIVEFAELGPFMDQKLKNYSSGMQVRLAFSIAIKAKNDVLIFDEVLAVGDEAFQRKCLDVFDGYKADGQTVILVTHDMETVKKYCSRAVLISEGKKIKEGDPVAVADEYSRLNQVQIDRELQRTRKEGSIRISLFDKNGKTPKNTFPVNSEIDIHIEWDIDNAEVVMVDMYKLSGEHITNFKSVRDKKFKEVNLKKEHGVIVSTPLPIAPGKYFFNVTLRRRSDDVEVDAEYHIGDFVVSEDWSKVDQTWSGLVGLASEWTVKK